MSGYFGKVGIGTTVNTRNSALTIHNPNGDNALVITEKDNSTRDAIVMEANNDRGWIGLKNATNTRIVLNAGGTSYVDEGQFLVGATSAAGSLFAVDGDVGITGELAITDKIVHGGDTDTYTSFGTDAWQLYAGGVQMIDAQEAAVGTIYPAVKVGGARGDVNFMVGSALDGGTDYLLWANATKSNVGINVAGADASEATLQVSGDASITG